MKNIKINIDKLNDDLFMMIHDQPALVDDFLREEGFDPSQLEKSGISKIKALLFKQKVALNKQYQERLYEKAMALFVSAQASTKEAVLLLLKERSPRLQYNNLEKMDQNDLRQILDESDLLDLMTKIEKHEI